MIVPRPYQLEAIAAVRHASQRALRRMGIMLPTGTGKSFIQALLAKEVIDAGDRVALVAPWDHLVDHAEKTLHTVLTPAQVGVVQADRDEWQVPCTVISISTILSEKRRAPLRQRYRRVIVDEMHYFMAPSWRAALEDLVAPDGDIVGFSATVGRADRIGLASVFGTLVYQRSLQQMITDGYLSPIDGIRIDARINLGGLAVGADYDDDDLERVLNTAECLPLLYEGWKKFAGDRVTIAFTPTVKMAYDCAQYWAHQGELVECVHGGMSHTEAAAHINTFTSGQAQIMFNAAKLIVGFDHPPVSAAYIIRPTRSQTFFIQMAGRATRLCRDEVYTHATLPIADRVLARKTNARILYAGGGDDVSLVQYPDLFDLPDHERETAIQRMRTTGTPCNLLTEPKLAGHTLHAERIDLLAASKCAWLKTGSHWLLSMMKHGVVRLRPHSHGYIVEAEPATGERTIIQEYPVALDWAMNIAEAWVRTFLEQEKPASRRAATQRNAKWRTGPLTEKQFIFLQRHCHMLTTYASYYTYVDPFADPTQPSSALTRGEAADIITKYLERKKAKASP